MSALGIRDALNAGIYNLLYISASNALLPPKAYFVLYNQIYNNVCYYSQLDKKGESQKRRGTEYFLSDCFMCYTE